MDNEKGFAYNSKHSPGRSRIPGFFLTAPWFLRSVLIGVVLIISLVLAIKFIFTGPSNIKRAKSAADYNKKELKEKKEFYASMFNNAETGKRRIIKDKDKRKPSLLKVIKNLPPPDPGHEIFPEEKITKTMVMFINPSYKDKILTMENGSGSKEIYKNPRKGIRYYIPHYKTQGSIVIPQGTVLNAYIKYKIFSYNIEVPAIAILLNDFYYRKKLILKRGCRLFGEVSVRHSLNRLNINFNKAIESNGYSMNIDAIAMMSDGSGGVKGIARRHYADNILASAAQGIAGASSILIGGGSGINSSGPYTFQNQVRENVARNELTNAQNGINDYMIRNQNSSISLPANTRIKIIFLKPVYGNGE